jgi:plasmid stabilization system protein ParE
VRVVLLEEARRQLEDEDEWWRANRDHPEVLLEDFVEVLRDLMKIPEAGQTYRRTRGKRIQRVLMKRVRCHVYYFHDRENDTIEIHSIWGAHRRRRPRL